jgi:sulfur carrier protein ThiS
MRNSPMQIRVQLMGGLKSKSPAGNRLELTDGATINDALSLLGLEATQVQIVMHNNRPQPNRATAVRDGDELTVVPPVGGG